MFKNSTKYNFASRTAVSGIRPSDLVDAPEFTEVQAEVAEILKGRVVVGHALSHDFKVLFLDHPRKLIRDTSKYKPFKAAFGNRTPSLKNLTARFLGVRRLQKKELFSLYYSSGKRPEWGAQFSPGQSGSCSTLHDAQVTLVCLRRKPKRDCHS